MTKYKKPDGKKTKVLFPSGFVGHGQYLPALDLQPALAETAGLVAVIRLVAAHPVMVAAIVLARVVIGLRLQQIPSVLEWSGCRSWPQHDGRLRRLDCGLAARDFRSPVPGSLDASFGLESGGIDGADAMGRNNPNSAHAYLLKELLLPQDTRLIALYILAHFYVKVNVLLPIHTKNRT